MNRCKKIALVCVFLTALNVVACGQEKCDEVVTTDESPTRQQESSVQIDESTNLETEENKTIGAEESNTQTSKNIDTEMTAEELLDLFVNGSISATSSEDSTSAFYITDLNMDSGEWDSYWLWRKNHMR